MTAPIVPVPGSGFWAASVSEVPALPPPRDTDEAPDTDPAPAVVAAVECPHPHQSEASK